MNIFVMIIDYVKEKNPQDYSGLGRTPLTLAVLRNHVDICTLILKNIVNKNPIIYWGNTILHVAAREGYLDICELILKNVVDKNPQNNAGKTPLTLASENNHIDVCALIRLHLEKKENIKK